MALRVGLRAQRGELLWSTAIVAVLAAAMVAAAAGMWWIIADHPGCDADFRASGCMPVVTQFAPWEQTARALVGTLMVVPILVGVLLGVAITAGELEHRTARMSWALGPSRLRWLAVRAAPVAVGVIALLALGALAAELAMRARLLTDDPGYEEYQLRSAVLVLRGLVAFAVGLGMGAIVGRSLVALLAGFAVTASVIYGIAALIGAWQASEAVLALFGDPRLLDGYPIILGGKEMVPGDGGTGYLIVPTSAFWSWVARESLLLVDAIVVIVVATLAALRLRSPG